MYKMFRKRGFNDRLYLLNFIVVWVFIALCLLLTVFSAFYTISDLSVVSVGIPSAFAELGIHTGFIVWKSKVENCRKHKDVNRLEDLESEVDNL